MDTTPIKLEPGTRFSRLVVISQVPRPGCGTYVSVRCDCGVVKEVAARQFKRGATKSCGCWRSEATARRNAETAKVGGEAVRRTPEYHAWGNILERCTNPRSKDWPRYGGRGIAVCERWRGDYRAFLADMGRKPSPQHSIERKDNNGNYEPSNCVWATPKEQAQNRRQPTRSARS